MASTEIVIRSIVGDIRSSIRGAVYAADVVGHLFFACHVPLEEINAVRQVYPLVARQLGRKPEAAARNVQRLARICWEKMQDKDLVYYYLGQDILYIPNACRLLGYLMVYAHLQVPFFDAIALDPSLLFHPSYGSHLFHERPRPPLVSSPAGLRGEEEDPGCCPGCGRPLYRFYQNFCSHCGLALTWEGLEREGDFAAPVGAP